MHQLSLLATLSTLFLAVSSGKPHARVHPRHPHPQASPTGSSSTGGGKGSGGVNLPEGCLTTANGAIGIGFDVGYGSAEAQDSPPASALTVGGKKPCVIGRFVDVDKLDTLDMGLNDANSMNSIYMISLTLNVPGANGADIATAVNNVANSAKQDVWLRLGYEMETRNYPGYGPGAFQGLWSAVASAVNRDKVKMYWCPNGPNPTYAQFYPSADQVDIAGVDSYPVDGNSVLQYGLTKDFCQTYGAHDIWVGELGAHPGSSAPSQAQWFAQGACPDIKSWCPSYKGFSWSEFDDLNMGDFRAVTNGQAAAGYQLDASNQCKTSP